MATYYWVGGSGNWNSTLTTNWATSSGGTGGAGVPTLNDDVVFDNLSNATAYTVTLLAAGGICRSVTIAGPASGNVIIGGTGPLSIYGNLFIASSGVVCTNTGTISFLATTTGWTITTNGVLLLNAITFNGAGGGWTLGSALSTSGAITLTQGAVATANFNLTAVGNFASTGALTRSLTLGSSSIQCNSWSALAQTNLTINAGTSTITVIGNTFNGGGLTYYTVVKTALSLLLTIGDANNTFNSLTITNSNYYGTLTFTGNQTIGTLTANGAALISPITLVSSVNGTQVTLTVSSFVTNGFINFRDINFAGAALPITVSTGGDCGNNSNITLATPKTVYWSLVAGGNWIDTAWATSSGGTAAAANYPLPQDTAIIDDAGLNSGATITVSVAINAGTIDMSARTLPMTFAMSTNDVSIYGNFILSSAVSATGTATWTFAGYNKTQTITPAGVSLPIQLIVNNSTVTVAPSSALTTTNTFTLTAGTLNLNGFNLTCTTFIATGTLTRAIAFGTNTISVTTTLSAATITGLTVTGTPVINISVGGIINWGSTGGSQSNAVSINITGSTPITSITGSYLNVDFTGYTGTWSGSGTSTIYGNFTLASGMTLTATGAITFAGTTGGNIVSNGKTITMYMTINGTGTWGLGSALTTTGVMTVTQGTFNTNNYNLSIATFSANSGTLTRSISLGSSTVTVSTGSFLLANSGTTFNAGTSLISSPNNSARLGSGSGTYIFYNVSFTNTTAGRPASLSWVAISGTNTFNNLTFATQSSSIVNLSGGTAYSIPIVTFPTGLTTTINGTLSISGSLGINRILMCADSYGSAIISAAATSSLTDIDFRNITATGASIPWAGTRIGNCLNNSGITFTAARTVYWNSTASANWNGAVWSTTSGNTGGTSLALPLAQDTIVINNAGLGTGNVITYNGNYPVGNFNCSGRTNSAILAIDYQTSWQFYNNITLSSAITIIGDQYFNQFEWDIYGPCIITFADAIVRVSAIYASTIVIENFGFTCSTNGNMNVPNVTINFTVGTLDISSGNINSFAFASSVTNTRVIVFGTNSITVRNLNCSDLTGLTYIGTPVINLNNGYNIAWGGTGGTQSNAVSINITGSAPITYLSGVYLNINFTGYTGTYSGSGTSTIYGNLTLNSGMCVTSVSTITFAGTTSQQNFTPNGVTFSKPITISGTQTVQLQGSLNNINPVTLTSGALDLNNNNLTCSIFSATGANTSVLAFGTGQMTVTGASFTAPASNLTITGTSTISMTRSLAKTFTSGGLTYSTLSQDGAGTLTITDAGTFNNITNTATPSTITFPAGLTTTVGAFNVNGVPGSLVTINSNTSGLQANLLYSGNSTYGINSDYLSIQDSAATPANTWYAGANSTDVSNNTGWIFTSALEIAGARLYNTGSFYVPNNSVLDEVTANTFKASPRITYSSGFDEVTAISVALRTNDNGNVQISGIFDEVSGMN